MHIARLGFAVATAQLALLAAVASCSSSSSPSGGGGSDAATDARRDVSEASVSRSTSAASSKSGGASTSGGQTSTSAQATSSVRGTSATTTTAAGSASTTGGTRGDGGPQDAAEDSPDDSPKDAPADTIQDATTDSPGGQVVSCIFTVDGMNVCTEFDGLGLDASTVEESACTGGNGGTFAVAACSSAGASGTCTIMGNGTDAPVGVTLVYYYYGLSSQQTSQAAKSCSKMGGAWA